MSGYFKKKIEAPGSRYDYSNLKAAKTITSKNIVAFEYRFPTNVLGDEIPYDYSCFKLNREEENVRCQGYGSGNFGVAFKFNFLASLASLDKLQSIIDEHGISKYNGISRGAEGLPAGIGCMLSVKYDSGERIFAADNSGPILSHKESLAFYCFFLDLAKEDNPLNIYSAKEFRQILFDLNGTFKTEDNSKTIILKSHYIDIFEGDNLTDHSYFYIIANVLYSSYSEDKTFTLYTHILWKDSKLIAFGKDDSQIEFLPI